MYHAEIPIAVTIRHDAPRRTLARRVTAHAARLARRVPGLHRLEVVLDRDTCHGDRHPVYTIHLRLHLDGHRIVPVTHTGFHYGRIPVESALAEAFRDAGGVVRRLRTCDRRERRGAAVA